MAEEHDAYDPNPKIAHMAAEILALRQLVEAILEELPERSLLHISKSLDWSVDTSRQIAVEKDTDPARDFADRMFEVRAEIAEFCHEAARNVADGAHIRTIQPAPIDPEDDWASGSTWPSA